MTRDIHFNCGHCGQRIVVDAAGAGLESACPGCSGSIVIPGEEPLADRASVSIGAGRRSQLDGNPRTEPLERELVVLRKENARLEQQLRTAREERGELRAKIDDSAKAARQLVDDLELSRERIKALETEATASQARRSAGEQELADARAEIGRLQEDGAAHRRQIDETRAKLATAEADAQRAVGLEAELHSLEEKLTASVADTHRLREQGEKWRADLKTARRELVQTESGRALAALRERFEAGEEERKRLIAELTDARNDAHRLASAEHEWHAQFDTMRRERDDALSRADSGSHSALQHGNDVLRGILDRQKGELDERYSELRRLRSAQLSLRIIYALIGLSFMAAVALGLLALHGVWR